MKPNSIIAVLILLTIACTAPKSSLSTKDSHNSLNSLDWEGVYTGTIPCADCEGIQTMIKLGKDLSYAMETKYQGKSEEIFKSEGTFNWDNSGSNISLNGENGKLQYKVGENKLIALDTEGKLISGNLANNYILTRDADKLKEKYWKLIELNGKPLNPAEQSAKEAHIILKVLDKRIIGTSGCNSFNGSYELLPGMRISLSQIASTRMACPNMTIEDQLFEVFSKVDNYTLADGILSLNRARMAPLARFKLIDLKK